MRPLWVLAAALFLGACGQQASTTGPHATVTTREGAQVQGIVTASTPAKLTLLGDDKLTHEIPTEQIQSVSYDAPAPPAAATATNTAPAIATPPPTTASTSTPPLPVDTTHQDHYHPPQAIIRTRTYLLRVGTEIPVRLEETIDSSKASEGQTYAAEVARTVTDSEGAVVIPMGSNGVVVIRSASGGGRIRGASDLGLDLLSVSVEGQRYMLDSDTLSQKGRDGVGANKRTAIFTGGGGAVGSIIGAIAGGGKGAAIGAGAGAGAGVLGQILTKGKAVKVQAETVLTFRLEQPLRVVAAKPAE